MSKPFYEQPILNSPYFVPARHHALGDDGRPLDFPPLEGRRKCGYVTPVPKARKQRQGSFSQPTLDLGGGGTDDAGQAYGVARIVDEIRQHLASWRAIPNAADWRVTPSTARLLAHWRNSLEEVIRPFFCQVEAVETVIWLTEIARGRRQTLDEMRPSTVAMYLSKRLVERYFREGEAIPPYHLVGKLQPITRRWLSESRLPKLLLQHVKEH